MPTLSEAASKQLLAVFGVPFAPERVVGSADDAVGAADDLGYPVVVKLGGAGIAHKTERGLVRLGLAAGEQVRDAAEALLGAATPEDGEVHLLVAPMLPATRELIAGLHHDPQFGLTVMLGVGGILTEAVADVTFRLVPIEPVDADEMIDDLALQPLLGEFRGEPAVDRKAVADVLLCLSRSLLVVDGRPVAVDALVEVR